MKRSTPEERRWENGLRKGTRTSNDSAIMSSPMVNRSSGLRRPTTETKRTSGNEVTPSLAATTALQEYLANDIDAKSRIPCPRPASGPVGKRQGNAKPTQLDVRVGINAENADTPKGVVVSRAESPLSRFQKHMKQTHSVPDQRHILLLSTTIPPRGNYHDFQRTAGAPASESAQSLTRSLMDKINEAKSLQQTEAASRGRSKHSSEPEILSRAEPEINASCAINFYTRTSTRCSSACDYSSKQLPSSSTCEASNAHDTAVGIFCIAKEVNTGNPAWPRDK
ncbi:hypothetical protein JG687_00000550 [Phytophthora cactorum]|uniref:Uncharacterized protein n=1 Tax=Phytophthora cactorum TaxID=29920 RepID=A0A8T1V0M7_9STRA|nr:hypothetical protein JG687_00000550 [Phytophthora cactorum]